MRVNYYRSLRYRAGRKAAYWFSKWPIAGALNHLRSTCWSDLVDWALHKKTGDPDEDEHHKLRYSLGGGERCRLYSVDHPDHTCYCGKFLDGELRPKDWTPDGAA
jgi:hypothetical protein